MQKSTNNTTYMTKRGIKTLRKEVSRLEKSKRELMKQLHGQDSVRSYDERVTRSDLLTQISLTEAKIAEAREVLGRAKQLPKRRSTARVAIGSIVELLTPSGKKARYTLVDGIEADPSIGKISVASPLGRSIIGKSASETITYRAKHKVLSMRLLSIY